MQHSPDLDVGDAFADPAFAALKARDAAFAVVRPGTREVLWANAAAARHWGATESEALGRAMFDARGGGWLDDVLGAAAPGRAPRLARGGLARGFRMRARTAMVRAWEAPDGTVLAGFAVPEAAGAGEAAPDAWRRPAWAAPDGAEAAAPPAPDIAEAEPEGGADASLARRGQLAILRDRLNHAVDGAASLRLLWRTDASDAVTQIDAGTFARLGSPLRFGSGALPDMVAAFDRAGAERLSAALAARSTWSGITLALPVADGAATAPLTLSASPTLGPDRSFAGFRGFGIVDLTRLDLAPPRPQAAAAQPDMIPAMDESYPAAATEQPGTVAAPTGDTPPRDAALPAAPPTADDAAALDGPQAPEAPAFPALPANVVHLRAFAATVPARLGASPAQSIAPPAAATMVPPGAEGEPAGAPEKAEPYHTSDHLAFVALGEALRAQIDAPAGDPDAAAAIQDPTADARAHKAQEVEATAADPEADGRPAPARPVPLIDQLPMALLVVAGGVPAFANAAAAARLSYPSPESVVAAGTALLAPEDTAPGALALRDGHGATLALVARSVPVAWEGAAATLWLFGDADATAGEAPLPAAPVIQDPVTQDPVAQDPVTRDDEAPAGELLDRVDDAVALLDADGRIRRLNRRGQEWFGRGDSESAVGRPFTEVLAPESHAAGLALLGEVRAQRDGGGAPPLSREVLALTGATAPVSMLLKLGRLGPAGFYATLRDVTTLRRAESERADGERTGRARERADDAGRLSGLLAKVNHEIRTPLSAILGFAEVMMDERFGPIGNPRYKDYLKDMHASGTQLVAMVGDLLDLSRIEAGEIELDVGAVDVNRIVAETVAQMQPEAHRERVIMRTSLAGRLPSVLADERSARQIVRNLLSNAVKFNEPGGQVIVSSALSDAGTVLLRVRDTGVGMTDDEIAAALEPFGATASPRPVEGHGLGLPLTRALVGANGASMAIRSRPREGTLVEVAFTPAGAEPARRPA